MTPLSYLLAGVLSRNLAVFQAQDQCFKHTTYDVTYVTHMDQKNMVLMKLWESFSPGVPGLQRSLVYQIQCGNHLR